MITFYVGTGSDRQIYPPDYNHEMEGFYGLASRLYDAFNASTSAYAVISSLRHPVGVDMLVITQHGIGVLELKHHPGTITIHEDGTWYSDAKAIRSGRHQNPLQQVSEYAGEVKRLLLPLVAPASLNQVDWNRLQFQTAVCFTNVENPADLSQVKRSEAVVSAGKKGFRVISAGEIEEWVFNLRFNVKEVNDTGKNQPCVKYDQYCLTPARIDELARVELRCQVWSELQRLLESDAPYGYLEYIDSAGGRNTFALNKGEVRIGRNVEKNDVKIPEYFRRVSRDHAVVKRQPAGVEIVDISKNGTYINGARVSAREFIKPGDSITLGGQGGVSGVCTLKFSLTPQGASPTTLNLTVS